MLSTPRIGFCACHGIVWVALVLASVAACAGTDTGHGRPGSPGTSSAVADDPPPGFATLVLAPSDSRPGSSDRAAPAPTGTVWYRVGPQQSTLDPVLEWYVRADHLAPHRVFRIELTVDDRATYSVGSARADDAGMLTTHGTLVRFADQVCVGEPAAPQSIAGSHVVVVSVKSDGSGAGAAGYSGPLTDPTRALPCGGNGDGVFEYWLVGSDPIQLGGTATKTVR